jgi:hypothetical protein
MKYVIPSKYFFRLHHIRPRFKDDVENVLIYIATELSRLSELPKSQFIGKMNGFIRLFPGNARKVLKTINNWRTEISSLFGLYVPNQDNSRYKPGDMAMLLAEEQDLVRFFKFFLFYFQYPGGHLKSQEIVKIIDTGIKFKPAVFILKLLQAGEKLTGKRFAINKAELTHCVFNDLRVTRDNEPVAITLERILENRKTKAEYDWTGDVIRYAGDIIDYMNLANLVVVHGSDYFLNKEETENISNFIHTDTWFDNYDKLYGKKGITASSVAKIAYDWFKYVNNLKDAALFKTDILQYIGIKARQETYDDLVEKAVEKFVDQVQEDTLQTKELGDFGENLIVGHEGMRLKNAGAAELISKIIRIPNSYAIGYDIRSFEVDKTHRLIEVKTTISSKSIVSHNIHLTSNEWTAAESYGEKYYVYRLLISKADKRIFIIQDPVGKYKNNMLKMTPREGADIVFKEAAGQWTDLLLWAD